MTFSGLFTKFIRILKWYSIGFVFKTHTKAFSFSFENYKFNEKYLVESSYNITFLIICVAFNIVIKIYFFSGFSVNQYQPWWHILP